MAKKYHVIFSPSADKDFDKLDAKIEDRILSKIALLELNPRPINSIKLKGEISHRLRIGDYRVVYEIDDTRANVIIFRIRHRKDVYR